MRWATTHRGGTHRKGGVGGWPGIVCVDVRDGMWKVMTERLTGSLGFKVLLHFRTEHWSHRTGSKFWPPAMLFRGAEVATWTNAVG